MPRDRDFWHARCSTGRRSIEVLSGLRLLNIRQRLAESCSSSKSEESSKNENRDFCTARWPHDFTEICLIVHHTIHQSNQLYGARATGESLELWQLFHTISRIGPSAYKSPPNIPFAFLDFSTQTLIGFVFVGSFPTLRKVLLTPLDQIAYVHQILLPFHFQ